MITEQLRKLKRVGIGWSEGREYIYFPIMGLNQDLSALTHNLEPT